MGNATAYLGWGIATNKRRSEESLPWRVRAKDENFRLFEFEDFVAELHGMPYPSASYDDRDALVKRVGVVSLNFGYADANRMSFLGIAESIVSAEACSPTKLPSLFTSDAPLPLWYNKLKSFYRTADIPWPGDAALGWWLMLYEF